MTPQERKNAGLWPEGIPPAIYFGNKWFIGRRTRRTIEKYGADARAYTQKQYRIAFESAWQKFFKRERERQIMTTQDRQEQLKRDIAEFEAWCRRVQKQEPSDEEDDNAPDEPFEDREAWEHRYGQ